MDVLDPALAAGALGFLLGLQHATDPDHIVAVATIMTRERGFRDGALSGALWGLGHSATLAIAGGALLVFGVAARVPDAPLELAVAAMLIVLGAARLREAAVAVRNVDREHLRAPHEASHQHGALEIVHTHPHAHGTRVHQHAHVHPSRRLVAALARCRGRLPLRPVLVGAMQGMAGSAALSLAVLATVRSTTAAVIYIGLFGLGTIVGMAAFTAVMAYPLARAVRMERARHAVGIVAGLGAIAFGLVYGYRAM